MITHSRCGPTSISTQDARRSTAWMVGSSIVLTLIGLAIDLGTEYSLVSDAVIYSAIFIALTISTEHTFLKPYSRAARRLIIAAVSFGWLGFFLGVTALANAI